MADTKVEIKGLKETQRRFNALARKLKNKIPLYKRIGIMVLNEIDKTFRSEEHEGSKWERLSPATIAARRKGRGPGGARILQDTGTLRSSFTSEPSISKVKVGTEIEYASPHEFGLGVPKRQMIPSIKRGFEIAIEVSDKYIKDKLKQAQLK